MRPCLTPYTLCTTFPAFGVLIAVTFPRSVSLRKSIRKERLVTKKATGRLL